MAEEFSYPAVRSEEATLDAVVKGKSIARYGDGEFKIVGGAGCVSQIANRNLAEEMAYILRAESSRCLVGIPTMDPRGPKFQNWNKYIRRYPKWLSRTKTYYSAFITRPDSAPWIYTPEYYERIRLLWYAKQVTLVSGSQRSLTPDFMYQTGADNVEHVECARRDAYADIDDIEARVRKAERKVVILCCGPTATCLAWRLHQDFHAIDLGHIGMFWWSEDGKLAGKISGRLPSVVAGDGG